ncbi:MAG: hypothetical protein AB1705_12285 [Verrucomicrobiota bacterium]
MIQLRSDCLVFEMSTGETIPCSAELVTFELLGDAAASVDQELIRNAAAAVLHYFKEEHGRDYVSLAEFSQTLAEVLKGFGLNVRVPGPGEKIPAPDRRVVGLDLRRLAADAGKGFELIFFQRLRDEMTVQLGHETRQVRFNGLRGCVKQLVGARRWTPRCQQLSDQIVEYLRGCLDREHKDCSLVVC